MNVRDYTMYVFGYIAGKDYTLSRADVKHLIEKFDGITVSEGIGAMIDVCNILRVTQAIKVAYIVGKEKAR